MRGLGLGVGLSRSRGEILVPIFTDTRVDDWTATATTFASSADDDPTNPGTLAVEVKETIANSLHRIQRNAINVVSGSTYRIQFVVRGVGRDRLSINMNSKSWVGLIASNTPDLAATLTNAQFTALGGGWYRKSVDLLATLTAGVALEFRISSASGITTYVGDITKGLSFGGVLISRVD